MRMKKYKLLKDLPTFKAGQKCWLGIDGQLLTQDEDGKVILMYAASTMAKFPNILRDWFEEILEPLKTVWDLEENDPYFYISLDGSIKETYWGDYSYDNAAREYGNCFASWREAEKELTRRKAKQILLRDTKGFKPNWKDKGQLKLSIYYDHECKKLFSDYDWDHQYNTIYFATEKDALESIKNHDREWKTYLGINN